MGSPNERVQRLASRPKSDLKELLSEELGESYNGEITNSLRNDFMRACWDQLNVDKSPFVKVQTHENYSSSWSKKKQLATVLRMELTEQVGRPEHAGITSLNKQVLAELITAIQQGSSDTETQSECAREASGPPVRDSVPPQRFEDRLPAEKFYQYALYEWILSHRSETDGEHGVYVLDCTPPVSGEEDFRVQSLRTEVWEKVDAGNRLSKLERAADALNNSERLYYVGYASDVPKRIREHVGGAASGGAKFTNMFVPQALVDVTWFDMESNAREYEPRRADELTVSGESFGYAE
ncbi:GIY-YIG nuclease family protein [Halorubrum sp. Ib24]|uniref:GIY-YIG nuclease family protein n=1 Tax=Halorubrum sp. Ib24 TaxID=1383850 RepID=UPI00117AFDD3|nr:GIY-YIG nuclease family protein [Halorubrum sp. Ib24]